MNPIIILEGVDGGGKTTLADWLVTKGWVRYHEGPPPEGRNQLEHYGQQLWRASLNDKPVVFDRLHLGEMAYGPVARDVDTLGYYGLKLMNRAITAVGARVFLCQPPWDAVEQNWLNKKNKVEYLNKLHQLHDVYHRYQGLYYAANISGVYDFTRESEESWYNSVYGLTHPLPEGLVGSINAKYLVVGEQANQDEVDWPFFATGGSSRYLNEALWEAGFVEEELAFMNARDLAGKPNDLTTVDNFLTPTTVIALGGVAQQACGQAELNAKELPHPAYWSRFHRNKRAEYVKKLKECRG